jgi:hypothetical protein
MEDDELEVFYSDLSEIVVKYFRRKKQRCDYPLRAGEKLFAKVTEGWINKAGQPVQLQ